MNSGRHVETQESEYWHWSSIRGKEVSERVEAAAEADKAGLGLGRDVHQTKKVRFPYLSSFFTISILKDVKP